MSEIVFENKTLPLIPLKDMVLFPGVIAPIFIGRKRSIKALFSVKDEVKDHYLLIVAQKKTSQEDPKPQDLYDVGVLAKLIQTVKLPGDNLKIIVESTQRVIISNIYKEDFFLAEYQELPNIEIDNPEELQPIFIELLNLFSEYVKNHKKLSPEILGSVSKQKTPENILSLLISNLQIKLSQKQELLEEVDVLKCASILIDILKSEISALNAEQALQQRVKKQIEKTQRDYYLHEQMKAIQKELDGEDSKSEFADIEQKITKLKLSKEAKEKAESELKKLKQMNPMSAESSVTRNYLEVLLGMPWGKNDVTNIDIQKAEDILNRDHFGLEKVKERIVEYLSVLKRSQKIKGPILCFIGPPGVGKTSLVKSIADAMGRKYCKFALGGVRDEAEIRGHRKTYLGSMPGKILGQIKKIKVDNPVMLLDEIDKMGADFRGDPSSALLEVLDPEQNSHFVDHYLEVEYDLSNVVFIATANSYNLPRPLIDRMEIINIAGYVEEEKLQIAKNYLVQKQRKIHGVKKSEFNINDDAILHLIRYYTKESGVRGLEREIGSLTRKILKKILTNQNLKNVTITPENIEEFLGVQKYRFGVAEQEDHIGSTTGLAYTEVGGDLLTIEAVLFPGKGEIKTTGKLGEVMRESVQAAYSCFKTRASQMGLKYEDYKDFDIHVHVPEGAIPKDGPSAGTAIFTTIVSLMTNVPVKRQLAMTGEITLRGKVLPIGGLKEKLLAASRGGIKTVLIPEDNVKDLKEIPSNIKNKLNIMPVSNIDQVLDIALAR